MSFSQAQPLTWVYELYRLGQSGLLRDTPEAVFDRILRHIVDAFQADGGALALCRELDDLHADLCLLAPREDSPGGEMTIVAGIGALAKAEGKVLRRGEGIIGRVAERGKPLLAADRRSAEGAAMPEATAASAYMCWPLLLENRVIGTLCVTGASRRTDFTPEDLEHGQALVNLIALVVDNVALHAAQNRRIDLLASLNERYVAATETLAEAHNRLKQSEDRLSGILNSLDDVVWSVRPDTLEPLYLNPAAEKVYGRPIGDFFEVPGLWLDIVHPRDRRRVESGLAEVMHSGKLNIDYRILWPDGEERWIHDQMRVARDDAGLPLRLDGCAADITEHKRAEDQLKKKNEELAEACRKLQEIQNQLIQSEKMASVGQLAAGVAHEINNPIGYVSSNLGSLENYVADLLKLIEAYEDVESHCAGAEEQLRQIRVLKSRIDLDFLKSDVMALLAESREGTTRVKKIVQDLKDFSHLSTEDDWQWTDLHKNLESTLNIVHNEIKYKAQVEKLFGDIPEVQCLPFQLNQVFMNLLVNAAHAIDSKGRITIATGLAGDKVWVAIGDTGHGIAPEHLNKIFDPFFTTKPVGKGTGLGLSVSYSVIQKHKGELLVDSVPGQGTTFRIVLPVRQVNQR
jgi:two-component system NtrC family sensor kinase